ncbi:hypothetical protein [Vibrio brasiliensis]|uniref:hypothetical protein n=1 Tax=Vibrio brasiliensis TaxID=170652 RepID=UPI001EFEC11E|nr:hypothetical protein [Vibrio brasiliensis]MCG9724500.1 hypothetical protein [Vibrio brasiliensis]
MRTKSRLVMGGFIVLSIGLMVLLLVGLFSGVTSSVDSLADFFTLLLKLFTLLYGW